MKKQNNAQKEMTQKMQRSCKSDKNTLTLENDVPPPKKESKPVPPPDYTLEELLENIPEPSSKVPDPDFSGEVDTGRPVGKENGSTSVKIEFLL